MIKKILGALAITLSLGSVAYAADNAGTIQSAPNRITDLPALQNGAKLFVNYCLSCHSANAMRYNKLTDLGLTEEEIRKNLLFTSDKVGDTMSIAMTPADSNKWFGTTPPDLSVIARATAGVGYTGTDYLYSYLRTFYRDAGRPTGWDNAVFPSVGMPHAMWQMQGPVTAQRVKIGIENIDGKDQWVRTVTDIDEFGFHSQKSEVLTNYDGDDSVQVSLSPVNPDQQLEFDSQVADLSNFLAWMAEPDQTLRQQIGVGVMIFLFFFLFVAWRLNKSYWKDVK